MFIRFALGVLTLGGVLCLPACTTDDDGGTVPAPTVLGTYEFDGEQYDILSVKAVNDGFYQMFSFSPLTASEQLTTYVVFGIRLYWLDREIDIQDVGHNDDYIFIYEDPVRCYSQYRRPLDGIFFVEQNSDTNYTVRIDFTLPDGTPFKMDFTGDFPTAE